MAETFGDWLRQRLVERGISNAEIAERSGLSRTYIGNLVRDFSPNTKNGKGTPSREAAIEIARALGVDVNMALEAAGYASETPKVVDSSDDLPDDLRVLLQSGKDYTPEDRRIFEIQLVGAVKQALQIIEISKAAGTVTDAEGKDITQK